MLYSEIMDANFANLEEYANNYTVSRRQFLYFRDFGTYIYHWKSVFSR